MNKQTVIYAAVGFTVIVLGMLTWSWASSRLAAMKAKKTLAAPTKP